MPRVAADARADEEEGAKVGILPMSGSIMQDTDIINNDDKVIKLKRELKERLSETI